MEVHHNGNGDLNGSFYGHKKTNNDLLVDEDEGEGKSLEIDDLLLDRNVLEHNLDKSNGSELTPTSGIVDDDDPFSDANDLSSLSANEAQYFSKSATKEIKYQPEIKQQNQTELKQSQFAEIKQFENKPLKSKRWSNLNEQAEIKTESANNTSLLLMDNSMNLTGDLTGDITVDSIKEHFNNLDLRNDVDLLLDSKDGKLLFALF